MLASPGIVEVVALSVNLFVVLVVALAVVLVIRYRRVQGLRSLLTPKDEPGCGNISPPAETIRHAPTVMATTGSHFHNSRSRSLPNLSGWALMEPRTGGSFSRIRYLSEPTYSPFMETLSKSLSSSLTSVNDPVVGVHLKRLLDKGSCRSLEDLDAIDSSSSPPSSQTLYLGGSARTYRELRPDMTSLISNSQQLDKRSYSDTDDNSCTSDDTADAPVGTRAVEENFYGDPDEVLCEKQFWMEEDADQPFGSYQEVEPTLGPETPVDPKNELTKSWLFSFNERSLGTSSVDEDDDDDNDDDEDDSDEEGEDVIDSATDSQLRAMLSSRTEVPPTASAGTTSDSVEESMSSNEGCEITVTDKSRLASPTVSNPLTYSKSLHDSVAENEKSKVRYNQSSIGRSKLHPSLGDRDDLHQSSSIENLSTLETPSASKVTENLAQIRPEKQVCKQSQDNSTDKYWKTDRKAEPTRMPSMLLHLRKKSKLKVNKKEGKAKDQHEFVPLAAGRATVCEICGRNMAGEAGVSCKLCLLTVHDNTCKNKAVSCDKGINKLPSWNVSKQECFQLPLTTAAAAKEEEQDTPGVKPAASTSLRHSMRPSRTFSLPPTPQLQKKFSSSLSPKKTIPYPGMTDLASDSFESLDGVVPSEISRLYDEPDLHLDEEVGDVYSTTVAEKKTIDKKDMKRQDTIWELINTEKRYVKRLKIMQKIFAHYVLKDLNYSMEQVNKLFPRLDELVDLHARFLRQLLKRQARNEDMSVDEIGDLLLEQFQGAAADKMKAVYGVFCSKHKEAMLFYKELLKNDRKFQSFAKYCNHLSVCEKKEISDFILGVTVRLSKYQILIGEISKNTRDKKDRENLNKALLACVDVCKCVDARMAAYDKLVDIQSKLDTKTVAYMGRKFKRQDLTVGNRGLVHAGRIGSKSANGKVHNILAVVLSDLIVFLQQNETKYTYFLQDNKACVISLYNLVVREKNDVHGSLGIYIISPNKPPEMYELVCQNKVEREQWMKTLQNAIRACPKNAETESWLAASPVVTVSTEIDKDKKSPNSSEVKAIIEKLHQKDKVIKECCDEKTQLMQQLLDLVTPSSDRGQELFSHETENFNKSVDIVQAAILEASHLIDIISGTGTQLSRSYSNMAEQRSTGYISTLVPKRAETFSSFDSNHETYKKSGFNQKFASIKNDLEERQQDYPCLNQQEENQLTPTSCGTGSDLQEKSAVHCWKKHIVSDTLSEHGSVDELVMANEPHLVTEQRGENQMASIYHLVQYLTTLMELTSKQCTQVESLRAELGGAKEEIAKLSADVHSQRPLYRPDQLEELRNLHEDINQAKMELKKTKLVDLSELERQREMLRNEQKEVEEEKLKLGTQIEAFRRRQDKLQQQINIMSKNGFQISNSLDEVLGEADPKEIDTSSIEHHQKPVDHSSSASADLHDTITVTDDDNTKGRHTYSRSTKHGSFYRSYQDPSSSSASLSHQADLYHFMDAFEPHLTDDNFWTDTELSAATFPFQEEKPSAMEATPASSFELPNSFSRHTTTPKVSRFKSIHVSSLSAFQQHKNSHSAPSDLSKLTKLPESGLSFLQRASIGSRQRNISNKIESESPPRSGLDAHETKEVKKSLQRIVYL